MKRKGPGTQLGTLSHWIVSYPIISYHTISYHIIWYHIISYHIIHSGSITFWFGRFRSKRCRSGEPKERGESITVQDKVDELQGPTLTPKEPSLLQLWQLMYSMYIYIIHNSIIPINYSMSQRTFSFFVLFFLTFCMSQLVKKDLASECAWNLVFFNWIALTGAFEEMGRYAGRSQARNEQVSLQSISLGATWLITGSSCDSLPILWVLRVAGAFDVSQQNQLWKSTSIRCETVPFLKPGKQIPIIWPFIIHLCPLVIVLWNRL